MAEKSPFGVFGEMFSVSNSSSLDQTVPNLSSPSQLSPSSHLAQAQLGEHFSRKVFVGGLPPDIDEGSFVVLSLSVYSLFSCLLVYCIWLVIISDYAIFLTDHNLPNL